MKKLSTPLKRYIYRLFNRFSPVTILHTKNMTIEPPKYLNKIYIDIKILKNRYVIAKKVRNDYKDFTL